MTACAFTLDQLVLSPLNVRTNDEDANDTGWLEDSIAAQGLIFPLIVHPLAAPGSPDEVWRWGVLDGGRRFRALTRLVEAGRLPPDHPIDCVVRESLTDAEITELSLSANLPRRDLRPYEVHAAIARSAREGRSVEEIATAIGQRVEWVRQQLRLGELAPEIFAAYVSGAISIEQARAYAATADVDLQRTAFAHFSTRPDWDHRPEQIRGFLKVGDREAERWLRFVGEAAYRAAGGTYELDLFADGPERGRVADPALLRTLGERRLEEVRAAVRLRARRSREALRFASEPPQWGGTTDYGLELRPAHGEDGAILLPAGDVVATVRIGEDGEAKVGWWWASRKAKAAAEKAARDAGAASTSGRAAISGGDGAGDAIGFDSRVDTSAARAARAQVRDEHGLSADGLQVVRSLRRELLRALLVSGVDDAADLGEGLPTLGRDYAIWAQLRGELRHERSTEMGARGLGSAWLGHEDAPPHDVVSPHLAACEAHAVWERAVTRVRTQDFLTIDDPAVAFSAFVGATEELKLLAGAVLAGLALLRSANVQGWRIAVHDRLATLAGGDDPELLRTFWHPTPELLALLPKTRRLELVQPFVDAAALRRMSAMKDGDLAQAAAGVLERECWVHPLLAFPGAACAPAVPAPPAAEACHA